MARILIGTATTDANGVATFPALAAGKYIFVEKVAPTGYNLAGGDNPIDVTAVDTPAPAQNTPTQTGTLVISKYNGADETNKPPVEGAVYSLKLGTKIMKSTSTTDATGLITYSNLFTLDAPQTYTITETGNPANFKLDLESHDKAVTKGITNTIEVPDAPIGTDSLKVTLADTNYSEYTLPAGEYDLYYTGPIV